MQQFITNVSSGQRVLNRTKALSKNAGLESQAKNSQIKFLAFRQWKKARFSLLNCLKSMVL